MTEKIDSFLGIGSFLPHELEGGIFSAIRYGYEDLMKNEITINILKKIFNNPKFTEIHEKYMTTKIINPSDIGSPTINFEYFEDYFLRELNAKENDNHIILYCVVDSHAFGIVLFMKDTNLYDVSICNSGYMSELQCNNSEDDLVNGIIYFSDFTNDELSSLLYAIFFATRNVNENVRKSKIHIGNIMTVINMIVSKKKNNYSNTLKDKYYDYILTIKQTTGDCSFKLFILTYFSVIYYYNKKMISDKIKHSMVNIFISEVGLLSIEKNINNFDNYTGIRCNNNFLDVLKENYSYYTNILKKYDCDTTDLSGTIKNIQDLLLKQYKNVNSKILNEYEVTGVDKNFNLKPEKLSLPVGKISLVNYDDDYINCMNRIDKLLKCLEKPSDDCYVYFNETMNECLDLIAKMNRLISNMYTKNVTDVMINEYAKSIDIYQLRFLSLIIKLPLKFYKGISSLKNSFNDDDRYKIVLGVFDTMFKYKELLYLEKSSTMYIFAFALVIMKLLSIEIDEIKIEIDRLENESKPILIPRNACEVNCEYDYVPWTVVNELSQDDIKELPKEYSGNCKRIFSNISSHLFLEDSNMCNDFDFLRNELSKINIWVSLTDVKYVEKIYVMLLAISRVYPLNISKYNPNDLITTSRDIYSIKQYTDKESFYESLTPEKKDINKREDYEKWEEDLLEKNNVHPFYYLLCNSTLINREKMICIMMRTMFCCNLNKTNDKELLKFPFHAITIIKRKRDAYIVYAENYTRPLSTYSDSDVLIDKEDVTCYCSGIYDSSLLNAINYFITEDTNYLSNNKISPFVRIGNVDTIKTDVGNLDVGDDYYIGKQYIHVLLNQHVNIINKYIERFNGKTMEQLNLNKQNYNTIVFFLSYFKEIYGSKINDFDIDMKCLLTLEEFRDMNVRINDVSLIYLINIIKHGIDQTIIYEILELYSKNTVVIASNTRINKSIIFINDDEYISMLRTVNENDLSSYINYFTYSKSVYILKFISNELTKRKYDEHRMIPQYTVKRYDNELKRFVKDLFMKIGVNTYNIIEDDEHNLFMNVSYGSQNDRFIVNIVSSEPYEIYKSNLTFNRDSLFTHYKLLKSISRTNNKIVKLTKNGDNYTVSDIPYFINKTDLIKRVEWSRTRSDKFITFIGEIKKRENTINYDGNIKIVYNVNAETYSMSMKFNNNNYDYVIQSVKPVYEEVPLTFFDKLSTSCDMCDVITWWCEDKKELLIEITNCNVYFTISNGTVMFNGTYEVSNTTGNWLTNKLFTFTPNLWLLKKNNEYYMLILNIIEHLEYKDKFYFNRNIDESFDISILDHIMNQSSIVKINMLTNSLIINDDKIYDDLIYTYLIFSQFDNIIEISSASRKHKIKSKTSTNITSKIGKFIYSIIKNNYDSYNVVTFMKHPMTNRQTCSNNISINVEQLFSPFLSNGVSASNGKLNVDSTLLQDIYYFICERTTTYSLTINNKSIAKQYIYYTYYDLQKIIKARRERYGMNESNIKVPMDNETKFGDYDIFGSDEYNRDIDRRHMIDSNYKLKKSQSFEPDLNYVCLFRTFLELYKCEFTNDVIKVNDSLSQIDEIKTILFPYQNINVPTSSFQLHEIHDYDEETINDNIYRCYYFNTNLCSLSNFYLYNILDINQTILPTQKNSDVICSHILKFLNKFKSSKDADNEIILKNLSPFEILYQGIVLLPIRKNNIDLINDITTNVNNIQRGGNLFSHTKHNKDDEKYYNVSFSNSCTYSMLMGSGKTKMVTPCVILRSIFLNMHASNNNMMRNMFVVLPEHLIEQTYTYLRNTINFYFHVPVEKIIEMRGNTEGNNMFSDVMKNKNLDFRFNIYIMSDVSMKCGLLNNQQNTNIHFHRNDSIYLFDEIDTILDPKISELNFPKNEFKLKNIGKCFEIIYDLLYKIYIPTKEMLEIINLHKDECKFEPHFYVIRDTGVVNDIRSYCIKQIESYDLNKNIVKIINNQKIILESSNDIEIAYTLYMFFHQLLEVILNLVNRRNYGTFDNKENMLSILPFIYVETPALGSQFSNPLLVTCLNIVESLVYDFNNYSKNRKKIYCDFIKREHLKLSFDCKLYSNIKNEYDKIIGLSSILPIEQLDYDLIPEQFHKNFFNNQLFRRTIVKSICIDEVKYSPIQDNIAGIDLIMSHNTLFRAGFTGTPSSYTFYDYKLNLFDPKLHLFDSSLGINKSKDLNIYEDDGTPPSNITKMYIHKMKKTDFINIKEIILNKVELYFDFDDVDVNNLIDKIIEHNSDVKVIIDVGGLLVGLTHLQIREHVINKNSTIKRFVFWDNNNVPKYIDNLGDVRDWDNSYINKTDTSIKDIFYYFDQAHTIGIDATIPYTYKGCVLIGKQEQFKKVVQGMYRMREVGENHTVYFYSTKKIGLSIGTSINNEILFEWLINNEINVLMSNSSEILKQNFRSLYRSQPEMFSYEYKQKIYSLYNTFNYPTKNPQENMCNDSTFIDISDEVLFDLITSKKTLQSLQDSCRFKNLSESVSTQQLIVDMEKFISNIDVSKIDKLNTQISSQKEEYESINVMKDINTNIELSKKISVIFSKIDRYNHLESISDYVNDKKYLILKLSNFIDNVLKGEDKDLHIRLLIGLQKEQKYVGLYYNDNLYILPELTGYKLISYIQNYSDEEKNDMLLKFVFVDSLGCVMYSRGNPNYEIAQYEILIFNKLLSNLNPLPMKCIEYMIYTRRLTKLKIISSFDSTYQSIYDTINTIRTIPHKILIHVRNYWNDLLLFGGDELINLILFNSRNIEKDLYDVVTKSGNPYVESLNRLHSIITCNGSRYSDKYKGTIRLTGDTTVYSRLKK